MSLNYCEMGISHIVQRTFAEFASKFCDLTDECLRDLSDLAELRVIQKHEELFPSGKRITKLYLVLEGSLKAFRTKESKEIIDWFAFDLEFITPINSFFRNLPSEHSIVALENTVFIEFPKSEVLELTKRYHCFETFSRLIITDTCLRLQDRLASLQFESASQKLEALIQIRSDILQRVSLTDIASYLGISLETLSRIRNPNRKKIEY